MAETETTRPTGTHQFKPIELNFDKMGGLVPFVLQHAYTGEALMMGFMNDEAWRLSCETGLLALYRRTLGRVRFMGDDDGEGDTGRYVFITRVKVDCDSDAVVFDTVPEFPICGHRYLTCFHTELRARGGQFDEEDDHG